jgi:ferredoxin
MADVIIDRKKCLAYGVCVMAEPRVFVLPDEDEVARVLRQPVVDDEWHGVNDAVIQCPTAAISIETAQ